MRLVTPKEKVYLGEVFTIEVQVYLKNVVQNAGQFRFTSLPADGFTVGKMTRGQQREEQIGNSVYNITPIYIALTAIKTGDFNLGPITASIVVQLPAPHRGNNDPFDMPDPFGMFQRGVQKQLTFATDSESIHSLPLPSEDAPPGFNGAIGNYTMSVNAGPTNVAVGDPITVHVKISGRGDLEALSLPHQSTWHDFKIYPPTSNVTNTDQLGIQGTKTFEEIVSPQNTNVNELPPFSFSFFDPNAGEYRTLKESALPLTVQPGGATPIPTVAAASTGSQGNHPPEQNIVPIKQRSGELATIESPVPVQAW
ncbi:MAG TPA: BatD family protein, partial [Verrucomicrobiae bacterium]|nr:BatD family protein [Verrucomicrobiae bacterium]